MGICGAYPSYPFPNPFNNFSTSINNLLGDTHHEVLIHLYTLLAVKLHAKRATNTDPDRYEAAA